MNKSDLWTYVCDTPKYSRKEKPERWISVGAAEQKMFRSYPFFESIPSKDNPNPKRFGDLVFDIDTGDTACQDAIKIIDYFESVFGVEYLQWRVYLSGKKGAHLELPDTVCGMDNGAVWLPLAYKTLAKQVEGDLGITLDISMYNTGTGKPYRQPNIMRDCGTCKRQIEIDQLYEIVDEDDYRAACSEPGETWEPEDTAINKALTDKLSFYLEEAEKHQKILAETPQLSERESEQLRKNEPPCVAFLRRVTTMPRSRATYNEVAMQLTGYAVSCGISEQQFLSACREFIYRYPSVSLTTPEKRLSNCRDRYRCMSANGNGFTCGGVLTLGFSSWDFDCSKCSFKRNKAEIAIKEPEENNITLELPEDLINPGGLISEIMAAMRQGGLPDIPQYNFPVVLAVLARAISGKMILEGYWPNLYLMKIGPTSSGKSSSDKYMQDRLGGIENFYGPSDFASGPALLRSLVDRPNTFIAIDEATKLFRRYRVANPINDEKKDVLMELHTKTGGYYEKVYANHKDSIKISFPCVTVTGNATPVIFENIKEEDFETGMMQRFDFFCYDGIILNRGRSNILNSELISKRIQELFNHDNRPQIEQSMNGPVPLQLSPEADSLVYDNWSRHITSDANDSEEGGIRGLLSRRFEASLKYAMIHHVSKNAQNSLSNPVEEDSVLWGIDLSKRLAEWKIKTLKGKVTTGEFHKDCEVFKEAIQAVLRIKGKRPTFGLLASRRPALKNWERKKSESVIEILAKRGEIVIDESGRSTAYYLGSGVTG